MALKGPALCEELLPYSEQDHGFVVCYGNLPCTKTHASTKEIADVYGQWGYQRGLAEVWLVIEEGRSLEEVKGLIADILGLNSPEGHVERLMAEAEETQNLIDEGKL